jgi:hypothetical protein
MRAGRASTQSKFMARQNDRQGVSIYEMPDVLDWSILSYTERKALRDNEGFEEEAMDCQNGMVDNTIIQSIKDIALFPIK